MCIELTTKSKIYEGTELFQVRCVSEVVGNNSIKVGDLGGWVCKDSTLINTWVGPDVIVINSQLTNCVATNVCFLEATNAVDSTIYKSSIKLSRLERSEVAICQLSTVSVELSRLNEVTSNDSFFTFTEALQCKVHHTHTKRAYIYFNGTITNANIITSWIHSLNPKCTITGPGSVRMLINNIKLTSDTGLFNLTDINHLLVIGPSVSSGRITTALWDPIKKKTTVHCGCFCGSIKKFKKQIRDTHEYNPDDLVTYLMFAKLIAKWTKRHIKTSK